MVQSWTSFWAQASRSWGGRAQYCLLWQTQPRSARGRSDGTDLLAVELPGLDRAHEEVRDLVVHDAGNIESRAVDVAEAQPKPIGRVALALGGLDSDGLTDRVRHLGNGITEIEHQCKLMYGRPLR